MKFIFVFLTVFVLFSCQNMKSVQKNNTNTEKLSNPLFEKTAEKELGKSYGVKKAGKNDRYILAIRSKKSKINDLGGDITYILYDNIKNEIIIKDFLPEGTVDWISKNSIMAIKRIRQKNGTYNITTYTYNVETKQKKELN